MSATDSAKPRKGCGCLGLFIAVWLVVFIGLGVGFCGAIVNENTNSHEIEIVVEDKDIVGGRNASADFVITATVVSERPHRSEVFSIRGTAREVSDIYAGLREGERYTVTVNGDPDNYRVITGIVG